MPDKMKNYTCIETKGKEDMWLRISDKEIMRTLRWGLEMHEKDYIELINKENHQSQTDTDLTDEIIQNTIENEISEVLGYENWDDVSNEELCVLTYRDELFYELNHNWWDEGWDEGWIKQEIEDFYNEQILLNNISPLLIANIKILEFNICLINDLSEQYVEADKIQWDEKDSLKREILTAIKIAVYQSNVSIDYLINQMN